MKTHVEKNQEEVRRSKANSPSQKQYGGNYTFQFVDNRPLTIKNRKLQNVANFNSNALQLNQIRTVIQLARPNPPQSQALIKDKEYSIGGNNYTIKSDKKSLTSVNDLLNHMAGEVPANWEGQVKGGHLKSSMDTNTATIKNKEAKISFTKDFSSNSPHNKPQAKWKWSSIDKTKETGEKMSTMWPKDWGRSDLDSVFKNSYLAKEKKGSGDMYLSAQGSGVNKYFSYVHLSDGSGPGTAYPETL